jgi:hypothetical protein
MSFNCVGVWRLSSIKFYAALDGNFQGNEIVGIRIVSNAVLIVEDDIYINSHVEF